VLFKLLLLLSIIIVNYNVKYFIEQCLYSVQKAVAGIDAEVIIVDNNSADESVGYLQQNFSWVTIISNKENVGYAIANNQGLQIAKGNYILFLNPDTIIAEDCLHKSISILQQDNKYGALGIHMVDGTGRFLPESKRGFPSPKASFFKLTGLIKIFPRSKPVAQYYMGWLPANENNLVEVLSGAYMMVKKEVLEKTGGFDEQFFMYGEDIELSYCIGQAGYKNYYLGKDSIIHFKGESTKKDIRYTKLFYKAMQVFVEKHYQNKSKGYTLLLQMAITISAGLSFIRQLFIKKDITTPDKLMNTIVVGEQTETKKAEEILIGDKRVKRKITCLKDITQMRKALQLQPADEIVFCAGKLTYKEIIQFIEQANAGAAYKFFATGSNSIVGSVSKKNSGEIIVSLIKYGSNENMFAQG